MTVSRRLVYPLCLLAGSLLAVAAGALHPDIAGQDGPSQLAVIAESRAWPAIHWAFLFSFPLSLLGLVGVVGRHVGTAGESPARAGVGIVLALVFREDTKADQAAFVLPVVWQLVTAVVMLRG